MEIKAKAAVFVLVFGLSLLVNNAFGAAGVHKALEEDAKSGQKNDMIESTGSEGLLAPEPFTNKTTTIPTTTIPTTSTVKPTTTVTTPATTSSTSKPTTPTSTIPPTPSSPTTSSTTPSTTTSVTTTTSAPKPAPSTHRGFDAFSFIGGFILAVGLAGIGMVSWKFYVSRQENYYHTL